MNKQKLIELKEQLIKDIEECKTSNELTKFLLDLGNSINKAYAMSLK